MRIFPYFLYPLMSAILFSCNSSKSGNESFEGRQEALNRISQEAFEKEIDGELHKLYELENDNGMIVRFTNTGASIVQVIVPDKNGHFEDITLGYLSVEKYLENPMYNGCIVGRYGNRISKGKFSLNGIEYQLSLNNNGNALHGGENGFHLAYWKAEENENSVKFSYTSVDMEEGYPGELKTEVIYSLNNQNELKIQYSAVSSDSTFVNLTNHTYWNLNGEANTDILDHEILIPADFITPVDEGLIPDGSYMKVENTPFDLREFKRIGDEIEADSEQIKFGGGFDHNFVLAMEDSDELHLAAKLKSKLSGRSIHVFTTEPGIQFYSGNFMDGSLTGKNGKKYNYRHALALETQHFPDSPNHENFPSTLLIPGEKYESVTVYTFGSE